MSKDLCTIVPAPSTPGSYTSTIGTKVLLPDGTQLRGVTGIKLIAHTNDVWRAEIECLAHVDAMHGMKLVLKQVGKHKVLVSEAPADESMRGMDGASQERYTRYIQGLRNRPIPPQYGSVGKTPLVIEVTPDKKEYEIKLTRGQ